MREMEHGLKVMKSDHILLLQNMESFRQNITQFIQIMASDAGIQNIPLTSCEHLENQKLSSSKMDFHINKIVRTQIEFFLFVERLQVS